MQRSLAYALSPAPVVPLRFLLTAPWFAILGALVLLWAGEPAFASRWSGATLGATHLLTLGYLCMAMAGAMLQLIPVVAGTPIALSRASSGVSWCALAAGALTLAAALITATSALFLPAAWLLALAFGLLLLPVVRALARPASGRAAPMVRGMRVAVAGLLATLALGGSLAAHLGGHARLPVLLLTDLHAAWGLLGWVAMLIICVAFQVIPMFQTSRSYPLRASLWAPWLLLGCLLGWSVARWAAPHYAWPAGLPLAAVLAAFTVLTKYLLTHRKRPQADATTWYWQLCLASLGGSVLLYFLPASEATTMAMGVTFIAGFAMGAVNGMLYKIVPFLLWFHLQQDPRAQKGCVPSLRELLPEARGRRQFLLHAAALLALLGAVAWPAWLARPAAALLAIASLHLALDLGGAARRARLARQRFHPS